VKLIVYISEHGNVVSEQGLPRGRRAQVNNSNFNPVSRPCQSSSV